MTLGPQFEQLQMLMTGKELKNRIESSADRGHNWDGSRESMSQLWDRKLKESKEETGYHGSGVYKSMKDEGLHEGTVVRLSHHPEGSRVIDAHHRIAAAADLEEQGVRQIFFPTIHYPGDDEDAYNMRASSQNRYMANPGNIL